MERNQLEGKKLKKDGAGKVKKRNRVKRFKVKKWKEYQLER
jgi:hypothetical protein